MWPQKSYPCDYYFVLLIILFCLFKEIRDYNYCAIRRFIPYHKLLKNILKIKFVRKQPMKAKNAQCMANLQCSHLIRYEHTLWYFYLFYIIKCKEACEKIIFIEEDSYPF